MSRATVELRSGCGCYVVCLQCPTLGITHAGERDTLASCDCDPPCQFRILFHPCSVARPDGVENRSAEERVAGHYEPNSESHLREQPQEPSKDYSSYSPYQGRAGNNLTPSRRPSPPRTFSGQTGYENHHGAIYTEDENTHRSSKTTGRPTSPTSSYSRSIGGTPKLKAKGAAEGTDITDLAQLSSKQQNDSKCLNLGKRALKIFRSSSKARST